MSATHVHVRDDVMSCDECGATQAAPIIPGVRLRAIVKFREQHEDCADVDEDACSCDFPTECDGSGTVQCSGCSGDTTCVCGPCGGNGEAECEGCDECNADDVDLGCSDRFEDD